MDDLTIPKVVARRLAVERMLLASVFIAITVAVTIGALAPSYLDSLKQVAFGTTLEQTGRTYLSARISASNIVFSARSLLEADAAVERALAANIVDAYASRDIYVRGGTYNAALPGQAQTEDTGRGDDPPEGFFQYLSGLAAHATFLSGRSPESAIFRSPLGQSVEAIISRQTSEASGIEIGDVVTLVASPAAGTGLSVIITGVFEAADPRSDYWTDAGPYLEPAPQIPDRPRARQASPEESLVGLFVSRDALVQAIGELNPGSLVDIVWHVRIDKGRLKGWPVNDVLRRFDEMQEDIRAELPGARVTTGPLPGLVRELERRSFYSGMPVLVLLAVMVVTVLFYMSMIVSYLARSRERDTALLRSRGAGRRQLFKLDLLTGLALTVVAVPLGAALAMGIVAGAGWLPYFREMTGGGLMPVALRPASIIAAAGVGFVCLFVLVAPGVLKVRPGLLSQKFREARPPGISWFQRYYLDVAILSVGGLVFWELHARGRIISGGVFEEAQINEALLLAPVLFLGAVGLVFMRLFPALLRLVSGESIALVNLLAASSITVLVVGIVARERRDIVTFNGIGPPLLLLSVAIVYWATERAVAPVARLIGLLLQAALIALFATQELAPAEGPLFVAALGLMAIVPARLAFLALRAYSSRAPVWFSMALVSMSRDPLQYSWLVLLLVLATGLGVLSTTVGGTLERSRTERVLYDVAGDLRITGNPKTVAGGMRGLRERYVDAPGVAAVALSLRTSGSVGPETVQVLGIDSLRFSHISWYREDFSERPLADVLGDLHGGAGAGALPIPDAATEIGVWVKPIDSNRFMSLWMVLKDGDGAVETVTLGPLGPGEWHLLKADIPKGLSPPLYLSAIQVFEPGGQPAEDASGEATGTAGELLLDDILAILGPGGRSQTLDGFEGPMGWSPIVTAPIPSDTISAINGDVHGGSRAARFAFGRYRNTSVRGLYRGSDGGDVPVVISSSLAASRGLAAGDRFVAIVAGRMLPGVVKDTVRYFPTMGRDGEGFFLADMDQLMGYLNMLGQPHKVEINELIVASSPGESPGTASMATIARAMLLDVEDGAQLLREVRLDPFAGAGLQALVVLALGTVLLAAGFGYAAYLMWFARRGSAEMGFLRSMGLSQRQLAGLLATQHLVVVAIGLGLGTSAGFEVSELMMSALAVTETGDPAVPPFVLATEWRFMAPTYGVLIAVFGVSLALLTRKAGRLDLQSIARAAD